ncbi:host attachment protein [Piscinibacter sp. HJYY11]|uniref:host attachment protein n=1 Tax=Piscinibacter sp. HJYY11 TaxID=2801333 RepID=UPI00191E029B|nr:host attachment protein [Piscinibacter sp. HJYY11]MBL0727781.1 host attachment protein [Piscinibacter sp. HJYY11]
MTKHTIWVVVADEAIARILERSDDGELEPVEEMTDAAAHAKGQDLRRDAVGRRAASASGGLATQGNATASAGADERHLEADGFARRVAAYLETAMHRSLFDELRLVAAPRFLGLLRKQLHPEVAKRVSDSLDKDLVHMVNSDITARLFPPRSAGGQAARP